MTSSQYQEYLDTYMRNITNTDLGNMVNIGNRLDHISKENEVFTLPDLGKHYKETWQIEDQKFAKKYGFVWRQLARDREEWGQREDDFVAVEQQQRGRG